MELKQALASLDTGNDELWTRDGDPKLDALKELTGNTNLKRTDVVSAAPRFSRKTPIVEGVNDVETPKVLTEEISLDELKSMPIAVVLADKGKCIQLRNAYDDEQNEAQRKKTEAEKEIKALTGKLTILNTRIGQLGGEEAPKGGNIQDYLKVNNQAKRDKALAMQERLKGLNTKDLVKAIDQRSELDKSLAAKNKDRQTTPIKQQ